MKILIAYSSKTGNTKRACTVVYEQLKDSFDITLNEIKKVKHYKEYDVIIAGFWVDKATANGEARKFITGLKEKQVALLGTLGAMPDSEHGQKTINTVKTLVDPSNHYYGAYLLPGKVNKKLILGIKLLPLPKEIRDKMYEASINSREATEEELQKAAIWVKQCIETATCVCLNKQQQ